MKVSSEEEQVTLPRLLTEECDVILHPGPHEFVSSAKQEKILLEVCSKCKVFTEQI